MALRYSGLPMQLSLRSVLGAVGIFTVAACGGSDSTVDAPKADATPIVDAAANSTSVTIPISNLPTNLSSLAFAYYDGSGVWTEAPAPVNNAITLDIVGKTYVLALGCSTGFFIVTTDLAHRAITDQSAVEAPQLCSSKAQPTLTSIAGTLTSATDSSNIVAAGSDNSSVNFAAGTNSKTFMLNTAPGTVDVFAARLQANGVPAVVKVERGFVVGATPITGKNLTLASGALTPTTVAQPGATVSSVSTLMMLNGTQSGDLDVVDAPYAFAALPTALARPTDLYQMTATNDDAVGTGDVTVVTVAARPTAITFETNLMAVPTLGATAVTFSKITTAGAKYSALSVGKNSTSDFYLEFSSFTDAYLAAGTTWQIPDFSNVTNWPLVLKAVTAKGRSFSMSATVTTGTPSTSGFRAVSHTNRVSIPATAFAATVPSTNRQAAAIIRKLQRHARQR